MVSHTTSQKLDAQQANQPLKPDLVTPDMTAPTPLFQNASQNIRPYDVIRLQRTIGNRATHQLIASKSKTPTSTLNRSVNGPMIQRLMSAEAFKQSTAVSFSFRSDALEKIDDALRLIDQTGADAILLNELQEAIDAWFSSKDASGPRRAGVEALQAEVSEELRQVNEHREDQGIVVGAPASGPKKQYKKDFSDFDTKQFRVSGRAPNRIIEEVKRVVMDDGRIVYYAMGIVTAFDGKVPVISPYPDPISLGDWYPAVTHINGMAVDPKDGILSASALQESVNKAMGDSGDVALGQEAVDVLYTYSAQRGGMVADVWDCIKGKVEVEDPATEKQIQIMLDAVHKKHRTTVSAHSRGTIKTDNAVMSAHEILSKENLSAARAEVYDEALAYWQVNDTGLGIPAEVLAEMTVNQTAGKKAKVAMNRYIHLVYAGNAVSYPSSILKPTMYVGGADLVSMTVGSYTSTIMGTKSVGAFKGHGFVDNYVPTVGKDIAKDIKKRH